MKRVKNYILSLLCVVMMCGCTDLDTGNSGVENSTSKVQPTDKKDSFEYKDGYAIVNIKDLKKLQKVDDFTNVCVIGTIKSISKTNDIVIVDEKEGEWTVDLGTNRDFSEYINSECEVYGFSTGGISSQHGTPLINMSHDDNHIVFCDEKVLYPEDFDSTQQFPSKSFEDSSNGNNLRVWISTEGGRKYHSRENCSSMENPILTNEDDAILKGYSKCGRCW